jgi:type IV pilus assembly protein PilM
MDLSFLTQRAKKREEIIAIDLGSRSTKAVHIRRKGASMTLLRYAIADAPVSEKSLSVDALAEHMKTVWQSLEAKSRFTSMAMSANECVVRHAELPQIPVEDMRLILKNNSKNYLQQDLANHVFDCWQLPSVRLPGAAPTTAATQKNKVIVGGARSPLVNDIRNAARQAGLIPDQLTPNLISTVNAFELALPEIFGTAAVALVDIGFKSSFICLLNQGELVASRVVAIGGDRLTQCLADAMSISYAEAEGIKVGMPAEVQTSLESGLLALGRELRASIDFFEHQQDKALSHVYLSGGSARSEFLVKALEAELMVPCSSWNPTCTLELNLPAQQIADLEQVAPQLTVALGMTTTI